MTNCEENRIKNQFSGEKARVCGAKGGASPKRKQTLDAKRIMRKLLESHPPMTDKISGSLETIGVDIDDAELTTNAGLMAAVIVSQALNGDKDAIAMAFEMAGQVINAKSANDARKLDIEEAKLDIEREKVSLMSSDENNVAQLERATELLGGVDSAIN